MSRMISTLLSRAVVGGALPLLAAPAPGVFSGLMKASDGARRRGLRGARWRSTR